MSDRSQPEAPLAGATGTGNSPAPAQGIAVEVIVEDDGWSRHGDFDADVDAVVGALMRALRAGRACPAARAGLPPVGAVSAAIAFDDDDSVRRLNRDFRGIDKATNVLSFPSGEQRCGHIGDIVLARETVEREAQEFGVPLRHHVQHLVLHGLLHLLGFDHESDRDAVEMEALESALLATLGVADPYAGSDPV